MSLTFPLSPRTQLCTRSSSNKHSYIHSGVGTNKTKQHTPVDRARALGAGGSAGPGGRREERRRERQGGAKAAERQVPSEMEKKRPRPQLTGVSICVSSLSTAAAAEEEEEEEMLCLMVSAPRLCL